MKKPAWNFKVFFKWYYFDGLNHTFFGNFYELYHKYGGCHFCLHIWVNLFFSQGSSILVALWSDCYEHFLSWCLNFFPTCFRGLTSSAAANSKPDFKTIIIFHEIFDLNPPKHRKKVPPRHESLSEGYALSVVYRREIFEINLQFFLYDQVEELNFLSHGRLQEMYVNLNNCTVLCST